MEGLPWGEFNKVLCRVAAFARDQGFTPEDVEKIFDAGLTSRLVFLPDEYDLDSEGNATLKRKPAALTSALAAQ